MTLPMTPEQVSAEWLTQAIGQHLPGVAITSVTLDHARNGTATKLKLTITTNEAGHAAKLPASLVVKGRFNPDIQIIEGLYQAEAMFYADLAPQTGLNVPRCFFSGSDAKNGQHIVILEDLECRGVTFCRVENPIAYREAASFLQNMARLHAAFWNSPELAPGGALDQLYFWDTISPTPAGDHGRRQLEPENWQHYMNLPRAIGMPSRFREREWMDAATTALNRFGRRGDVTLVHGDFHLGNLYLEADGTAGVLDWQSYAKGSWSHDLTYFLVSALDIEDRRRWDRALVAYYLDCLREFGVAQPPSLDEAMEAFRIQIVHGLFYWAVNPVEWQVELNNCSVVPRFAVAALDLDTAGAVEAELGRHD